MQDQTQHKADESCQHDPADGRPCPRQSPLRCRRLACSRRRRCGRRLRRRRRWFRAGGAGWWVVSLFPSLVDPRGHYSNIKLQVRQLESLRQQLPSLDAPIRRSSERRNPGRARRLSEAQVEELVAGYNAGATVYELGERFGISRDRGKVAEAAWRDYAAARSIPGACPRGVVTLRSWLVTSADRGAAPC